MSLCVLDLEVGHKVRAAIDTNEICVAIGPGTPPRAVRLRLPSVVRHALETDFIDSPPPYVMANPGQLQQVVLNLISTS